MSAEEGMDEIDTATATAALAGIENDEAQVDDGLTPFDVEFVHARETGVEEVRAADAAEAKQKAVHALAARYPGTEAAEVVSVELG